MLDQIDLTEVIVAAFLLVGTIYGHWKTAQTSMNKTIDAVKSEVAAVNDKMKAEIQSVRDELAEDRMVSKATDEEMHAELLLFKQESTAAFEKQISATGTAIDKATSIYAARTDQKIEQLSEEVRRHNDFARRVPVMEKQIENIEKQIGK